MSTHASEWALSHVEVSASPAARTVVLRGALSQTMHMGSAQLALDTGVLVFVDEDLRDAVDWEHKRVTLSAEELARVLLALPPK